MARGQDGAAWLTRGIYDAERRVLYLALSRNFVPTEAILCNYVSSDQFPLCTHHSISDANFPAASIASYTPGGLVNADGT